MGEPGVGKTRLASAIADEAAARGFAVAYGRCDEGLAAPFRPLVDALTPWLFARVDGMADELRPAARSAGRPVARYRGPTPSTRRELQPGTRDSTVAAVRGGRGARPFDRR